MDGLEASDYRATLGELTVNNKNQINLLTILAEDYKDYADAIVESIDQHLHKVSRECKLPAMYLADSIVKNITDPYKKLFERIIVKMFVHCFKNGDERVRSSLWKLRDTWRDIFARGKLYELDMKVNQEDPNWPIDTPNGRNSQRAAAAGRPTPAAPAASDTKVHVNPKFVDKSKMPTMPPHLQPKREVERATPSTSRTVVIGDGNDVKVEVKPSPILKKIGGTARDPRATKDPRGGKIEDGKKIKTEPIDEPMPSEPTPPIVPKKIVKKEEPAEMPVPKKEEPKKEERRKRVSEDRKEKRKEESDRSSPPPKHARRSPIRGMGNQRGGGQSRPNVPQGVPLKPTSSLPPPNGRQPHAAPAAAVATPTNVVGSHAFSVAPRAQPSPPIPTATKPPSLFSTPAFPPPVSVAPFASGPIPGLMPAFTGAANNPFGPNRSAPMAPMPLMGPPPSTVPSAPFMAPPPSLPPPNQRPPLGPPPGMPERKHVFKDDNRLEGIPANNRIFVDGKAYEVLYINQTAVIEKDGLPHRIYFQGVPRNVVIDGTAYQLAFGETREVVIDGDRHMIRFGAPSRELYMGDYPFKGAFGGAPIIATINGRRHEIRLAGPAPEVKIEPEPSYELSRFLAQARAEANQAMAPRPAPPPMVPVAPKVEPKADLNALLGKLKASGIMEALNAAKEKQRQESPPPVPIASDIRGGSDRAPAPSTLFEKEPFDMRLLKTRYDSVVGALLAKRSVCHHCGLRLEKLEGPRYDKHMDWHVQKNLAASTTKSTKSREWYCSLQDWVAAKDTAEDEDSGEGVDPFGKLTTIAANARKEEEEAKKPSVNSDEAQTKSCAVCGDDFEEFYDEDSDKWKLRDCIHVGNQVCHESCAPDLSHMDEPAMEVKSEEMVSMTPVMRMPIDPRLAAKSSPMA